jgi:hypothetical protein
MAWQIELSAQVDRELSKLDPQPGAAAFDLEGCVF